MSRRAVGFIRAVVVDKLEKLPREKIEAELTELGVSQEAMDGLLTSLSLTCVALTRRFSYHPPAVDWTGGARTA